MSIAVAAAVADAILAPVPGRGQIPREELAGQGQSLVPAALHVPGLDQGRAADPGTGPIGPVPGTDRMAASGTVEAAETGTTTIAGVTMAVGSGTTMAGEIMDTIIADGEHRAVVI